LAHYDVVEQPRARVHRDGIHKRAGRVFFSKVATTVQTIAVQARGLPFQAAPDFFHGPQPAADLVVGAGVRLDRPSLPTCERFGQLAPPGETGRGLLYPTTHALS